MREDFEVLCWQEAIPYLQNVNSQFTDIIYEISPPQNYRIIKATYHFGEHIFDRRKLQIPYNNKLYPIDSKEIPDDVRQEFATDELLMSIPLNKVIKNYLDTEDTTIPIKTFNPGDIVGLWATLCSNDESMLNTIYWTISAGCRSLYLLPKISDDRSFNRIKKEFNLSMDKPLTLFDQADLFNDISKFQNNDDMWSVDVLIFSKQWSNTNTIIMDKLRLYLYTKAWNDSKFLRDSQYFHYSVSKILNDSSLKTNPYIRDTLSHLYSISEGQRPSFLDFK